MTRFKKMLLPCLAASTLAAGLLAAAGCKSKEGGGDTASGSAGSTTPPASSAPTPSHDAATPSPSPAGAGGSAGTSAPANPSAPGAPAPGQAPSPAPALPAKPLTPSGPPKQVVAKVNGHVITRGMLDFMVMNVVREQNMNVPPERHAEMRKAVLNDLISKELLYQKATASNFTVTPTEVSNALAQIKSSFADEKTFEDRMKQDGMDQPTVELMIRQGASIDKFLKSTIEPKVKVTPDEEAKFYESNKERMHHPEQIRASHILLRVEPNATPEVKAAQKAKAEDLDSRAKKGEDFAALAKANSQDPGSAARGGDLGWFSKKQMVPGFDEAAWALKKGEISPVVESQFGFHIIKELDHRADGYTPLDEVRPQIRDFLSKQKVQDETQKVIDAARATAKIEVTL